MADPAEALGLRPNLDDGYGAVPLRWSGPVAGAAVQALTVVGALAVGFLLAVGLSAGRSAAVEADARKADLVALVRARQERADALGAQLDQLRADVAAAQSAAAASGPADLRDDVTTFEAAAGLTGLAGPGLRVTLTDAEGACPTGNAEDCQIQDADLQRAVNAVFAAGAEGVAVNGERVIATTAIRNAGGAVLVNYRVLTSPYALTAIGNPDALGREFGDAEIARDFAVWEEAYGLGFEVAVVEHLRLPAYDGSVRFDTAAVQAAG